MNKNDLIEKYISKNKRNDAYKLLQKGIPVQYIIKSVDFCGFKINVDNRVLIPRFETEFLVDKTVKIAKNLSKKKINILDLGTGSGCIAISLAKLLNAKVTAVDISKDALDVAKKNAKENNANIKFVYHNMEEKIKGNYDIIISNPPYIGKKGFVEDIVRNNEPNIALFTKDDDGLYFYRKILKYAFDILNKPGFIAFEIGDNEKEELEKEVINCQRKYMFLNDYSNLPRYLFIFNE